MNYFLFALLVILTVSCNHLERLKAFEDYPVTPVSKDNYRELNGTYSNQSDTAIGTCYNSHFSDSTETLEVDYLLESLITNIPESAYRDSAGNLRTSEKGWIQIDFTSPSSAVIRYYRGNQFIFSEEIFGKMKKGYFYRRPRWYFAPFIPLFFAYNNELVRIGKSGEHLVVDYYLNSWGMILIAGGSIKNRSKAVYTRKKPAG